MKRMQLFEFEDFNWFPNSLRMCMTRYIVTIHKILETEPQIASILKNLLSKTNSTKLVDFCSGGGGPMPTVLKLIKEDPNFKDLTLTLTDLYPNFEAAEEINVENKDITYLLDSVDATQSNDHLVGVRTMICSLHHMPVNVVKNIFTRVSENKQAFLAFEISDNSYPKWLWWIAFPFNIIGTFLLTPLVRPLTWQQIVFTYVIPILPILIAWDGAVSNARTYTEEDLKEILKEIPSQNYTWNIQKVGGKGGNKIYIEGSALL